MANNTYDDLFDQWGRALNVDPQLTKTIFHLESSGNADSRDGPQSPDATNGERAGGGMQLLPSTARAMATRLGADPNAVNIRDMKWAVPLATAYLAEGLNATGHPSDAMAYYFAGPDRNLWKSKTASYVAKGEALYPQMALQNTAPDAPAPAKEQQPQMPDILDRFPMAKTAATAKPDTAAPAGDILSMFPMAPAAPKKAEAPSAAPVAVDDLGRSLDPQSLPTLPESVGRIGSAIKQGWESSQPILTPAGVAAVDRMGPLGRMVINPAARLAGAVPAALNAMGAGTAQAIVEGANAAGVPGIGRDINMGMQVAPFARMGAGMPIPHGVPEAAPATRFIQEHYGEGQPGNPLAPTPALPAPVGAPAPSFIPPGTKAPLLPRILELLRADDQVAAGRPAVVPPDAIQPRNPLTEPAPRVVAPAVAAGNKLAPEAVAPEPQSVGAAASRDTTIRTADLPTETKSAALTNLQKDVTQSATDRAGPGMEDHTVYVPGVERTLAGRVFTPQNALDEKLNVNTNPEFRAKKEAIDRRNNETMVDYLREDARDPIAVEDAHKSREAVAPPAQKLFEGETAVDASGVVKKIDEILSGPGGKRGAVSKVLGDVRDKLFDSDGNLETAPSQLYGARQNITDWLKKAAGAGDSAADARLAKAHLVDLLDQIDPVINSGAPKYQSYLKEFSQASKPIDQMEFLQRYQTGTKKITGVNGELILSKVQKMLDDIYQGRSSSKNDPAQSLTDAQIQRIVAVRNELAASALKDRMASVKGSDSVQQIARGIMGGPLGTAVKGTGTLAAHVLTHHLDPTGFSNLALAGAQHVVLPAMKTRADIRAGNALMQRQSDLLSTQGANRLAPP